MMRMSGRGRAGIVALALGILLAWGVMPPADSLANRDGFSGHHRGGHGDFASRMLHHLLRDKKDLNLSEEQVGRIKTIALDYTKMRIMGEAESKLADVDARALFFDDKAEFSAIEGAIRKSEKAKTAVRIERARALRSALAVLTPEQRDKFREGMRERHRDRDDRHAADAERESSTFDLAQGDSQSER
jgi:protein CpxP